MENWYEELSNRLDGFDDAMKEFKEGLKLLVASSNIKKSPNGHGGELEKVKTTSFHEKSIKFLDILFSFCNPFSCFKFTNEDGSNVISSSSVAIQSISKVSVDITNKECFDNQVTSSSSQSRTIVDENMPEDMKNSRDCDDVMEIYNNFKKFDMLSDHSEHNFAMKMSSVKMELQPKAWHIRIEKEWTDLKKQLPEDMFVRAYEGRKDLLTVVIIGPKGTPYHDGLFFFDLGFPSSYPNIQPWVWYHYRVHSIHPCLTNGFVHSVHFKTECGKPKDVWVPGTSNMLQYLEFLQNLFNRKPKLIDNAYRTMVSDGLANGLDALVYNENAYINSLKTMVSIIKKPPKYFEDFVAGHFRNRAVDILKAYEAYTQGVQVGCFVKGALDEGNKGIFSITFYDDLESCIKPLVSALKSVGAKVDDGFHTLS